MGQTSFNYLRLVTQVALGLSRLACFGFGVVVEDSYYNIQQVFLCLMKFFGSLASNVYYIVFHT